MLCGDDVLLFHSQRQRSRLEEICKGREKVRDVDNLDVIVCRNALKTKRACCYKNELCVDT